MWNMINKRQTDRARKPRSSKFATKLCRLRAVTNLLLLMTSSALLSSCGGTGSSHNNNGPLTGNWQFDQLPLQGGFLVQNKGSVTGQLTYSVSAQGNVCNSGSASVTGTVSGQTVSLQAVAGPQTVSLNGTISGDGSTMSGTYNSTDGQGCGTAQSGSSWTAMSVPPLRGNIQGNLHSNGLGQVVSLANQDFPVTGFLIQGPNIGASSANITGSLNFPGYPCLATASVNGQISGNVVILQIIAANGLTVGQIGAPAGSTNPSPVVFQSSAAGGYVVQGASGYGLSTKSCKGGNIPGDVGNICLALGTTTACTQPVALSPASLIFPPQLLGSPATTQAITLTNSDPSGAALNNLQLLFQPQPGSGNFPISDFDGLPNFTEQDNCTTSPGSSFSLAPQQSCTITVSFSPQQSCPWLPSSAEPSQCPPFLPATVPSPPALSAVLTVTSPTSADTDKSFAVPISGVGLSSLEPSTPELDFGSQALGESSPSQLVTFTNQNISPVQILPALSTPPCGTPGQAVVLSRPLISGSVPGLQVVTGSINSDNSTITYICDLDPTSGQPNFQIRANSDTCSGSVLAPQQSCSIEVSFAPQPGTPQSPAPDYFLELNTLQCTTSTTTNCEIDAGRFPVELKANLPSPLRMSPGAGLDFGIQSRFQTSAPLTITLFNDPNDPHSQTVNFTGNLVKGDYAETDNCGSNLGPGSSCTMRITFTPSAIGFDQGNITITYNAGQTQTVYLRGTGQ